jgi:hypothetical protein
VAGQLEATDVLATARGLEAELRAGHTERIDASLRALESALEGAVASAGRLRSVKPGADLLEAETHADTAIDVHALAAPMTELRRLLGTNSLKARSSFAGLRTVLAGTGAERYAETIAGQLERLDYRGAERTLDDLMKEVGLD